MTYYRNVIKASPSIETLMKSLMYYKRKQGEIPYRIEILTPYEENEFP
jgi:hypothetical protein